MKAELAKYRNSQASRIIIAADVSHLSTRDLQYYDIIIIDPLFSGSPLYYRLEEI